jgi:hypothetical protein
VSAAERGMEIMSPYFWVILGIVAGVSGAAWLIWDALTCRQTMVGRVCVLVAGGLLLRMTWLLVSLAFGG